MGVGAPIWGWDEVTAAAEVAGAWSSKLLCGLTLLYSSLQRWRVLCAPSRSTNQCCDRHSRLRRPHRASGIERGTGDIYLPKIRRIALITRSCSSSVIFVEHGMLIAVAWTASAFGHGMWKVPW